jgi:hypothetical protein
VIRDGFQLSGLPGVARLVICACNGSSSTTSPPVINIMSEWEVSRMATFQVGPTNLLGPAAEQEEMRGGT